MSVRLCSLNELKSYLRIAVSETAYDSILGNIIEATSSDCETATGITFTKVAYTDEKHMGGGSSASVKNWPIDSSASVTVKNYDANAIQTTTLLSTNYDVDYEAGIIRLVANLAFSPYAGAVLISYTGGYATSGSGDDLKVAVPDGLSFSVCEYAAARYKKQQGVIDDKELQAAKEAAEAIWGEYAADF